MEMMASHKGTGQRPAKELDALLDLGHSLASQQGLNDVIFQIILRLRHVVDADAVGGLAPVLIQLLRIPSLGWCFLVHAMSVVVIHPGLDGPQDPSVVLEFRG